MNQKPKPGPPACDPMVKIIQVFENMMGDDPQKLAKDIKSRLFDGGWVGGWENRKVMCGMNASDS
jgi:hypothetical protein